MKSLLKYPGGKWRIAEWIISYFPTHKVYCEPFFGSGAVFFTKTADRIETINDVDGNVVNLFKVCREYPDELARMIELTPFSREEFIACEDLEVSDPIERARRTIIRYNQSFGTSNSSKCSWKNSQKASSPSCHNLWNYLPRTIAETCARLKEAQIENIDALELIKRYDDSETLLYLDPPYPQCLRKNNLYQWEMNDARHEELLQLILKSKSKVIISSYDNALYNEALSKWYTAEKSTLAQMGLPRTEKLYMNYMPPLLAFGQKAVEQ